MIQAEEFGLTPPNVDQIKAEHQNPDIQRFLGVIEEKGKELGLPNDFAVQIIKQVGNYGESFDRNLGPDTPLKIAARPERALEEWRPDVQSAVPVSQPRAGQADLPCPSAPLPEQGRCQADPGPMQTTCSEHAAPTSPSTTTRASGPSSTSSWSSLSCCSAAGSWSATRWPTSPGSASPAASASSARPSGFDIGQTPDRLQRRQHLRPRLPGRLPQHHPGGGRRHHPGDDHRLHDGHRPAVAQLARVDPGHGLCRDGPQHPAAAASSCWSTR